MSDEIADAASGDGPIIAPYVPFPSFATWSAVPFDSSLVARFELQLDNARANTASEAFNKVVEQATRSAAVDTGALEGIFETDRGFTYSVAVGAALSEISKIKGEVASRAISDALNAYEYVLNAATGADHITEVWIRELHSVICASQETYTVKTAAGMQQQAFPKGIYKNYPNNPLQFSTNIVHSYAPVIDTAPEMARLVEQLRLPEFESAHPVVQAAYAHFAFVSVHPFSDGNGRVSRALASTFLYRKPGIPLVIFADQKGAYLDSLEAADVGNFGTFQDFVKFRVIDSLSTARQSLRTVSAPTIESQLEALSILQTGRANLPHAELDSLALYLLECLRSAFELEITAPMRVAPLSTRTDLTGGEPEGTLSNQYRRVIEGPQYLDVEIVSAPPAAAAARRLYVPVVARPGVDGPDLFIVVDDEVVMEAFVHDLLPALSESLMHRARLTAANELSSMLAEVVAGAAVSLRTTGYGA